MAITTEDVKKLAALARIKLTPEEEVKYAKDMENILGYVTQIQKVSGTVVDVRGTEKLINVMRNDNNPHEPGAYSKELVAEAPKKDGEYIKVKKILG